MVSIHAPARGGDLEGKAVIDQQTCFNPRPRARGRLSRAQGLNGAQKFQSTPPREGATRWSAPMSHTRVCFNPRPRARGRHAARLKTARCRVLVSIHAPARGGDLKRAAEAAPLVKFQSTPPREGATPDRSSLLCRMLQFQSTPPREGATAAFKN